MGARIAVGLPGVLLGGMAIALAATLGLAGCGSYGVEAPAAADTVSVALPAHGSDGLARLFLYRITAAKSGEKVGIGREFRIEEGRQVRAVLQLEGLDPASGIQLHVMWLNPDGKRAFVKEIYVQPTDWGSAERRQALAKEWVLLDPRRGQLEMESRYGVDPGRFEEELHKTDDKRTFKPGRWTVRVYWFRTRLLETSFELLPEA